MSRSNSGNVVKLDGIIHICISTHLGSACCIYYSRLAPLQRYGICSIYTQVIIVREYPWTIRE